MVKTSLNLLQNYWKVKKFMRLKQSLTTEDEGEGINTTLNGEDTLSLMHHGNQRTLSLLMVTFYHDTNSDISSNTHSLHHFHNDLRSNLQHELGAM